MKKQRANVRSTRAKQQRSEQPTVTVRIRPDTSQQAQQRPVETDAPLVSQDECNIFCCAALGDAKTGTFYTDMSGAFPTMSLEGMQYYFIAYDYDTNNIFAVPTKDLKDETIIAAFEGVFNDLKSRGYMPKFNVTDNQATGPIKEFLKAEDCEWQFVKPANHRVNAAKRAIQTFKNHFISGLPSTDSEWPLQLWDRMGEQA